MTESRERFVTTRMSGCTYGKMILEARSSTSRTAVSYGCRFVIVTLFARSVAMPVWIFAPALLFRTSLPNERSASQIKFEVVVLPFVPVTPMMNFGFET